MESSKLIVLPESDLIQKMIGSAMRVHSYLGAGLLESSYEACLEQQLKMDGISCKRQVYLPIEYYGIELDAGYRLDFLVEDRIILEIKSAEKIDAIHEAQVLTYLKLTRKRVGFIFNFNVPHLRQGIKRFLNSSLH